ncbi:MULTISPECIES: lipoate--protein ligase family protein [Thioalkalivibrio]|uniref:Lipoate--protein ligase n=1 Tax=Thioalkalivibrio halophilus TaxID=252474 RepID=A0A1V2ZX54_9GAMM|nr:MULTISPECIES: biotin/lipoate A/B protein ligase family protein [Thioalkalivibrio]OOC09692.1 lipoate--protein ligase [Thioalkalivibrio halophilus]
MPERDQKTLRILDTGLRPAAENMAFNRALLECHQEGHSPHTLRFLQFEPCALVGFHQNVDQEIHADYCREQGIAIQRRITGGGAIYFDSTQLGWELYLDKQFLGTADMGRIAERICTAAAEGMQKLGVDARFRPRNDIEVDGRKISGTGGAFDGESILYQGTLLIEFDVEDMLRILRIPAEKLSDKAIESARDRVANMATLLGETPDLDHVKRTIAEAIAREFAVEAAPADLLAEEDAAFREALAEIDNDEWVYQRNRPATDAPLHEAVYRCDGGLMRVGAAVDPERSHLKQVWITGDVFVKPTRTIADLEASLKDTPVTEMEDRVRAFFAEREVEMLQLTPEDFIAALREALAQAETDEAAE